MNNAEERWTSRDRTLRADATDLRVEVVLAELINVAGITAESFIQWPNGGPRRTVEKDVERLHPPGAVEWSPNKAVVELNRTGLYDLLPEGLFHQVKRTRPFVAADDAVEEVRHNNAIEEAARSFFLPLDDELLRTRLAVELNERRLTAELLKDRTGRGVTGFWDPPPEFKDAELGRLLMLLPRCHRITGHPDAMATAIGGVLGLRVHIHRTFAPVTSPCIKAAPPLNESRLGLDTVLYGATTTMERVMIVSVGPLDPQEADNFGPDQPGLAKMERLMEYLAPADQVWRLDILVNPTKEGFTLGTDGVSRRLGVSTTVD